MALLCSLALAAPASADTIGATGGDTNCNNFSRMEGDVTYQVPASGGTITSFSFGSVSTNAGQQLDFLVLRSAGGTNYTVVGKTGLVTLAGTGAVETFPANIPVQGGDILGLWIPASGLDRCNRSTPFGGGDGGGEILSNPHAPDPTTGDTVSLPDGPFGNHLNESANLTPPGPTNKDQCKKGGWQSFGGMFKNQGECVRLFGGT